MAVLVGESWDGIGCVLVEKPSLEYSMREIKLTQIDDKTGVVNSPTPFAMVCSIVWFFGILSKYSYLPLELDLQAVSNRLKMNRPYIQLGVKPERMADDQNGFCEGARVPRRSSFPEQSCRQ